MLCRRLGEHGVRMFSCWTNVLKINITKCFFHLLACMNLKDMYVLHMHSYKLYPHSTVSDFYYYSNFPFPGQYIHTGCKIKNHESKTTAGFRFHLFLKIASLFSNLHSRRISSNFTLKSIGDLVANKFEFFSFLFCLLIIKMSFKDRNWSSVLPKFWQFLHGTVVVLLLLYI
jgi:hypothetical protein